MAKTKRKRWMVLLPATLFVAGLVTAPPAIHRYQLSKSATLFRAQVAELRSCGDPISTADLIPTPVPSEDNAAVDLLAAAQASRFEGEEEAWGKLDLGYPLRDDEKKALEPLLADRQEVDRLVARAITKPGMDWQIQYRPQLLDTLLPHLNQMRLLINQLRAEAFMDSSNRRYDAALERIREILFIADRLESSPMMVGHLVANGARVSASQTLISLLPELEIGDEKGNASTRQVRSLLTLLLDESQTAIGLRKAVQSELVMQIGVAETALDHPNPEEFERKRPGVLGPIRTRLFPEDHGASGRTFITYMQAAKSAVSHDNVLEVKANLPPEPEQIDESVLIAMLLPGLSRFTENHFESVATSRVAAVALAARWYEVDHGRLPAKLEDLVPAYLTTLPSDPMTRGVPLRYVATGDRPVIYSVARNGADDDGKEKDPESPVATRQKYDISANLKFQPRKPPKPADDEATKDECRDNRSIAK